jgi:hypothetical protein
MQPTFLLLEMKAYPIPYLKLKEPTGVPLSLEVSLKMPVLPVPAAVML